VNPSVLIGGVVLGLMAGGAQAVPITAAPWNGGQTYEVTTVVGTWNDLESVLRSQPWWGWSIYCGNCLNPNDLAGKSGAAFGYMFPNNTGNGVYGPLFAYNTLGSPVSYVNFVAFRQYDYAWHQNIVGLDLAYTWAVVGQSNEQSNVPLPATIALLGLGLVGIGAARRKQA
jgi:hypothetical protein